jgi:hypothetical protein
MAKIRKSPKSKSETIVGIVMGSKSDWPTMEAAAKVLDDFSIRYEVEVVSAHRTPRCPCWVFPSRAALSADWIPCSRSRRCPAEFLWLRLPLEKPVRKMRVCSPRRFSHSLINTSQRDSKPFVRIRRSL